ncbi:MAG: hypothetical protein GY859_26725, partial [Desulfobacterales bacterium]|nr:hypothetical protein [Desulfobacterales bacterium]
MSEIGERLYSLLPAVYRIRDAEHGEALRTLMAVMEREFDRVRDDIDQLYENWFVETCQEWVLPYIGDLLGVRDLHEYELEAFSIRSYIANTLALRRRKGTASVLEQLALDITGRPARVVEFFKLIAATQHVNHIRPQNLRTPDLRDAASLAALDSPFETIAHAADVRNIGAADVRNIGAAKGKYNIPNIGIFLWRMQSYYLAGVAPRPARADGEDGRYYFNPLGANQALFNRPVPEPDIAHVAEEINVPGALRRRALFDDLNESRGKKRAGRYFGEKPVFEVIVDGRPIPPERIFINDLSDREENGEIGWNGPGKTVGEPPTAVVDPRLGRLRIVGAASERTVAVGFAHGFSADIGGGPYSRRDSVETWLGGFIKETADDSPAGPWQIGVSKNPGLHAPVGSHGPVVDTLAEAVGAWRQYCEGESNPVGIITILDNASYVEELSGAAARITMPG